MHYSLINKQIAIGNIKTKNRLVFPPIAGNWSDRQGRVTQKILHFYKDIASGGSGMIIVGGTAISKDGMVTDRSMRIDQDTQTLGLKRLFKLIKANGVTVGIQLVHVGGQGNPGFTGKEVIAPSAISCKALHNNPRALMKKEIIKIEDIFVEGIRRSIEVGADCVELHCAHGYLLHQFLSPRTNKRKDEYGGSLYNRMRLIRNIIRKSREKITRNILIGLRISGDDLVEGGLKPKDAIEIAKELQRLGISYISVTAGIYDSGSIKHKRMKDGYFINLASKIKRGIKIPVIAVGKVLSLSQAEEILTCGYADMVAMGRAQIADPLIYKKSINGYEREVLSCTECDQCAFLRQGRPNLTCSVNERVGK